MARAAAPASGAPAATVTVDLVLVGAVAATASGLCETVLITHGESGRSGVWRTRNVVAPTSLAGQFEQPYRPMGPLNFVHDPGAALHDISRRPREKRGPRSE